MEGREKEGEEMKKMVRIKVGIPDKTVAMIDRMIEEGLFKNRSNLVQHAILQMIECDFNEKEE